MVVVFVFKIVRRGRDRIIGIFFLFYWLEGYFLVIFGCKRGWEIEYFVFIVFIVEVRKENGEGLGVA